jgi:hypothetical protein
MGVTAGAVVGFLAGAAVVDPRSLLKPVPQPMKNKVRVGMLVGAALGAVVGGVLTAPPALAAAPSPALPRTPPSPAAPSSTGFSGVFITLVPNQSGVGVGTPSQGIAMGAAVTVQLPAGAQWADPTTGTPNGSTTPISWTYQGPGVVTYVWQDATGQLQRTTMTFYTQG